MSGREEWYAFDECESVKDKDLFHWRYSRIVSIGLESYTVSTAQTTPACVAAPVEFGEILVFHVEVML